MDHYYFSDKTVGSVLLPLSKHDYETKLSEKTKGSTLNNDRLNGQIPEDYGDGFSSFEQHHAATLQKIDGTHQSIRKGSLLRYQDFVIPEDVTKENVEALMYQHDLARIAFGMVHLAKAGMFHSMKHSLTRMYWRDSASIQHGATAGLKSLLDDNTFDKDTFRELQSGLSQTQILAREIRAEEAAYVDTVLGLSIAKVIRQNRINEDDQSKDF